MPPSRIPLQEGLFVVDVAGHLEGKYGTLLMTDYAEWYGGAIVNMRLKAKRAVRVDI